jgi:F-type H+-transporting ATPase subunit b
MAEFFHEAETWVAIAFVIFFGIIMRVGYGRIVGLLDKRSEKIGSDLDDARKLREEAQSLLADYQRKKRDAEKEAEEIISQAKEEAIRLAKVAAEKLEETVKRRTQVAIDKIANAEVQAILEVRNTAVDVAVDAARALIADNLDEKKASELIDTAAEELDSNLH